MAAGAAQFCPATVALPARKARSQISRLAEGRKALGMASEEVRMRFDHVSIAVKSIDRAYEFFSKYFPITMRSPKTMDEQVAGSFYWQELHLGGFVLEMIEDPPTRPGFVTKFIETRGQGIHHLSSDGDNVGAVQANFEAGGGPI